jgi:hypothetical protein
MLKDAFGERKGKCEIRLKAWRITRPIPAVASKLWSCPLGSFFTNDKICRGFSPALEWKHALAVAEATQ